MSRIKIDNDANYFATIDDKGYTRRMKFDASKPFQSPHYPEIEDVAINNVCKANCFVEGTKVHTDKGLVDIEDIIYGDIVQSYNLDNKKFESKPVEYCFVDDYEGELIEIEFQDYVIRCTPNHKFLTDRGYIPAKDITIFDNINAESYM